MNDQLTEAPVETYRGFLIYPAILGDGFVAVASFDPSTAINAASREAMRKAIWEWWECRI